MLVLPRCLPSLSVYKAYLLKSGYKEENIDRKFIDFIIEKKKEKKSIAK